MFACVCCRRKFGLVCALLNQCVYILFVILLMVMMKKQVDANKEAELNEGKDSVSGSASCCFPV